MRKSWALVSLVLFSWIGGLGPDARAGVTIDLQFQDMAVPSGFTLMPGYAGPGCDFGGYYHGSVSVGYCSDVILTTSDPLVTVSGSVHYDTDNGLDVASYYEWRGVGVSFNESGVAQRSCSPLDGITDSGTQIDWFGCGIMPPSNPPVMPAGTYRLGTIVWDTTGIFIGADNLEWVSVVGAIAFAVINGNVVDVSGQVVLGRHRIGPIPEPGTAALLGLGLVGLTVAARRRRG